MDWTKFFLGLLKSMVLGSLLGAVALGAFGYYLAGREGFVNMATWGLFLGVVGGMISGLTALYAKLGTDVGGWYAGFRHKDEHFDEK